VFFYSTLTQRAYRCQNTFAIAAAVGTLMFNGDKSVQPIYNVLVVEHYCPLVCINRLTSVSFRRILQRYGEMNVFKILEENCLHAFTALT